MSSRARAARTAAADELCAQAYRDQGGPETGVALVAVGGYGRGDLAPCSDLDVVLLHDDGVDLGELGGSLWYPLWDSGHKIDHAVRTFTQTLDAAADDLKVALGLLDVRHLAGDPNLTLRLRTTVLARWRAEARERLPQLRELTERRHESVGEVAHAAIPDIKEGAGGIRDTVVLNALVATWLVDLPHAELGRARRDLLRVRDALHEVTGRAGDRINPETWEPLAAALGLADAPAAQRHVRELGRRVRHLGRLTWRRVDAAVRTPARMHGPRRPELTRVAPGLALHAGEIVLDGRVDPRRDPVLLLAASAEAAQRNVVLAPSTAARLVRECPDLPDPWPDAARHQLIRLLASGRSLLPVWETLEETGAISRFLPEWERILLLPHASIVHRFTVDRHVVETCIEAGALIRDVARPDVLMVAALLHDIGKGGLTEHCLAGEPLAREIARRIGFDAAGVDEIARLVRWHLLLAQTATSRDPDDPATVEAITATIDTPEGVRLLEALTEADARATSAQAWTTWRAGLVRTLAARARAALQARAGGEVLPTSAEPEVPIPAEVAADRSKAVFTVEPTVDGARVRVVSGDRIGLLADAAATLAVQRAWVRGAKAWNQGEYAISVWDVAEDRIDPAVLRQRFEQARSGGWEDHRHLRIRRVETHPSVEVRPEASREATVLEVRAGDQPGLLFRVLAALARIQVTVRSAHVNTLGPQAVDVFYLQEWQAGALGELRAAEAAHAVRDALVRTEA